MKIDDTIEVQNKVSKVLFSGDKAGQATDPEKKSVEGENENWDKNDYHAMVLMGGFKKNVLNEHTRREEEKWYFVILNGWPNMPLFVASGDYSYLELSPTLVSGPNHLRSSLLVQD